MSVPKKLFSGLSTRTKIAFARLLYVLLSSGRRLFRLGDVTTVRRRRLNWRLDLRQGIDLAIFLFGRFESETVRAYSRILKPGDVAVDIGANIGAHTLPMARRVGPTGSVIAFEPTDFAFAKLRINVSLNPELSPIIRLEQQMLVRAVGSIVPPTVFSSWPVAARQADAHPTHLGVPMPTTGAQATSLDAFVLANGIRRIDFIKLDVDGHECDVLFGARETLARFRPTILMEVAPYVLTEHGTSLVELLEILHSAAYGIVGLDGSPLPADGTLENHVPAGGGINVLCLPRQ